MTKLTSTDIDAIKHHARLKLEEFSETTCVSDGKTLRERDRLTLAFFDATVAWLHSRKLSDPSVVNLVDSSLIEHDSELQEEDYSG